ncbi:hypothetical protein [Roseibium suaedae]|uniref:Uncharacterized protein n=1 Tax=Roseibium suaedae TaxID=735517 RepID=A0A1M7BFS8_9HYPH|nr:hypothetical protein [Roseibium suaedae]SHL53875.1 hypothetical protein SAMN05444272_0823 [Roseibium suaedae]
MSNFKAIIDLFGFTEEGAAQFLSVDQAQISRWCNTADGPPVEVWQALVSLFDKIRFAAEDAAKSADLDHLDASDLNRIALIVPDSLAGETGIDQTGPRRAATAMAVTTLARVFV